MLGFFEFELLSEVLFVDEEGFVAGTSATIGALSSSNFIAFNLFFSFS